MRGVFGLGVEEAFLAWNSLLEVSRKAERSPGAILTRAIGSPGKVLSLTFIYFFIFKRRTFNIYLLIIYLFWLCRVLAVARGTFLVAARGLLSYSMHAQSRSPTRDGTRAPCIGSTEPYPLDHKGSLSLSFK